MKLAVVQGYKPTADDIQRELKMQQCLDKIQEARTPAMKRRFWNKYTSLHNQRGPDYVAFLDAAKRDNSSHA